MPAIGGLVRGAAELALVLSAASSGVMGIAVAVVELKRGKQLADCVARWTLYSSCDMEAVWEEGMCYLVVLHLVKHVG